jgi:hypothetical protein
MWVLETNLGLLPRIGSNLKGRQWWHTPLIPALRRQRQTDFWVQSRPGLQSKFQDSQGYREKPCLKKKKKKKKSTLNCWAISPAPVVFVNQISFFHIKKQKQYNKTKTILRNLIKKVFLKNKNTTIKGTCTCHPVSINDTSWWTQSSTVYSEGWGTLSSALVSFPRLAVHQSLGPVRRKILHTHTPEGFTCTTCPCAWLSLSKPSPWSSELV